MFLLNQINLFYFLLSLFIGLFVVYSFSPKVEIIYKYPTPENCKNNIYKDISDNCYKYVSKEVDCPNNPKLIEKIPIQIK
jgi:hypothetical protein